jgi:hypothetical protein
MAKLFPSLTFAIKKMANQNGKQWADAEITPRTADAVDSDSESSAKEELPKPVPIQKVGVFVQHPRNPEVIIAVVIIKGEEQDIPLILSRPSVPDFSDETASEEEKTAYLDKVKVELSLKNKAFKKKADDLLMKKEERKNARAAKKALFEAEKTRFEAEKTRFEAEKARFETTIKDLARKIEKSGAVPASTSVPSAIESSGLVAKPIAPPKLSYSQLASLPAKPVPKKVEKIPVTDAKSPLTDTQLEKLYNLYIRETPYSRVGFSNLDNQYTPEVFKAKLDLRMKNTVYTIGGVRISMNALTPCKPYGNCGCRILVTGKYKTGACIGCKFSESQPRMNHLGEGIECYFGESDEYGSGWIHATIKNPRMMLKALCYYVTSLHKSLYPEEYKGDLNSEKVKLYPWPLNDQSLENFFITYDWIYSFSTHLLEKPEFELALSIGRMNADTFSTLMVPEIMKRVDNGYKPNPNKALSVSNFHMPNFTKLLAKLSQES